MKYFYSLIKVPFRKWLTFLVRGISCEGLDIHAIFLLQEVGVWERKDDFLLYRVTWCQDWDARLNWVICFKTSYGNSCYYRKGIKIHNPFIMNSKSPYSPRWSSLPCSWVGWPSPETMASLLSLCFPCTCLLFHGLAASTVPPQAGWQPEEDPLLLGLEGCQGEVFKTTAVVRFPGSTGAGKGSRSLSARQWIQRSSDCVLPPVPNIGTFFWAHPSCQSPAITRWLQSHKKCFLSSSLTPLS